MTPQEAISGVIRPALQQIGSWSPSAEILVLATFIHESKLKERRQIVNYGPPIAYGPALGLAQMETVTHDDCWRNYLAYRPAFSASIRSLTTVAVPEPVPAGELVSNDRYAAAMCRVKYRRSDQVLPSADDLPAIAAYWKRHYNTVEGAGTVDQFLADWHAFMA